MRRPGRILCILLLILTCCQTLCALNDRTFCEAADIGLIPMDRLYYLPKFSRIWSSTESNKYNEAEQDPNRGTYITGINNLGKFGIYDTGHNIEFTVSTGDGRFVGVSDPTKYRDFYVGLFPRSRYNDGTKEDDRACFCLYTVDGQGNQISTPVNHEDRIPNTKGTNYVSIISPIVAEGNHNVSVLVDNGMQRTINRWWCDVVLCLEPLTYEDEMHLQRNENAINDEEYIATVSIEWHCLDPDCNKNHSGAYTFVLIGYYGANAPAGDMAISMFVIPDAAASNLRIADILNGTGEQRIAGLQLYSFAKSGGKTTWDGLVTLFVSSNQAYQTAGEHFYLDKTPSSNSPYSRIPFEVKIVNSDGITYATFDGTDNYQSGNKVDYSDYVKTSKGKNNNDTSMIEYMGDVYIELEDPDNSIRTYYSGIFKETIYYHVVYNY